MQESLCKTCNNIFAFPECYEESLEDSIKSTITCRNYRKCDIPRDCLLCSNSHSEPKGEGDILHCIAQDDKVVKEDGFCSKWN